MRKVLLIAFHFPPFAQSSGIQRTQRFAQYLPEFGWEPTILTVKPYAYPVPKDAAKGDPEAPYDVVRTPCFNAAVHMSVMGRYPGKLALPDRWASWYWFAPRVARALCRERGIDVIWSTYPIATAHKIGAAVSKSTGLPWIADFRDPMAQPGYPSDPRQYDAFVQIEREVARHASALSFTTPSALDTYQQRYESINPNKFRLIENGYDESTFSGGKATTRKASGKIVLLHSGIVYPSERNPEKLFEALQSLKAQRSNEFNFLIRFRASAYDAGLSQMARQYGVEELIEIAPSIPYQDAIDEMLTVDGLLVLQADNCNEQIPAKIYEYFRAARPVLGLADPAGDTGKKLLQMGYPDVAPLESAPKIFTALINCLTAIRSGQYFVPPPESVTQYSRKSLTGELAKLLTSVAGNRSTQK